jgi:SAM-dependent methyltransferase
MKLPRFMDTYRKHTARFKKDLDEKEAMSRAVGGAFEAIGQLEVALLRQHGLKPGDTLIDVGCGSGRLAFPLREYLRGRYIGMDVVPDLVDYARQLCQRPDWSFYEAPGLTIPEPEQSADMVCFFSVFTHLLHEESFKYLKEAARVLKPDGRIVFSFLEFHIPSHWAVFAEVLADERPDKVLNQFMSRDAILAWAPHCGLQVLELIDGDKPHIPLATPVTWEDGRVMTGLGNLGQSVCVMARLPEAQATSGAA